MSEEKDYCLVCGEPFIRTHPKQITCAKKDCKTEWKTGSSKKVKISKTYTCLRCGKATTKGYICKECSKINQKIQEWETW